MADINSEEEETKSVVSEAKCNYLIYSIFSDVLDRVHDMHE